VKLGTGASVVGSAVRKGTLYTPTGIMCFFALFFGEVTLFF
jgi:hypothetical protein